MRKIKQGLLVVAIGLGSGALAVGLMQTATGAGGSPKVWGTSSTKAIDDFTGAKFRTVLKQNVKAPSGYLDITAALGFEDDCSDSEPSWARVLIKVDHKALWHNSYAYAMNGDCDSNTEGGVITVPIVVKVGSGHHLIELQASDANKATTGIYIEARSITTTYESSGSAKVLTSSVKTDGNHA